MQVMASSLEAIKNFEDEYDVILPQSYVEFLRSGENSQGMKVYKFTHLYQGYQEDVIRNFREITDENRIFDVRRELNSHKNQMPNKCIPIASTVFGDKIILCLTGEIYGQIFHWDHENQNEEDLMVNMYFISSTFKDFINELRDMEEY